MFSPIRDSILQTFRCEHIEWNNFQNQKNKKGPLPSFGVVAKVEREIAGYMHCCGEYRKEDSNYLESMR